MSDYRPEQFTPVNIPGENAFPEHFRKDGILAFKPGMTLRQYYAGQALAGLVSSVEMLGIANKAGNASGITQGQCLATMAIEFADSLIAELEANK